MKSIKVLSITFGLILSSAVSAMQFHTAIDGEQVNAEISAEETSRITLINDRIKQFFVSQGRVIIEKDETKGDIYLTPTNLFQNKNINLFITSEQGKTYSLVLAPKTMSSTTIAVKSPNANKNEAIEWEQSNDYETTLVELIKTVSIGGIPKGYEYKALDKNTDIKAKGFNLKIIARLQGDKLNATIFELKNTSDKTINLAVTDFAHLNSKALALESHKLHPKQIGKVFMVGN